MEKDITKICAICNHTFIGKSSYKINKHILQEHGLNLEQYILKTLYNDIRPTCKCGCGENLKFYKYLHPNYFYKYKYNHHPPHSQTKETREKISLNNKKTCLKKYGVDSVFKLPKIRNKIKKTCLEKYDVEFVTQNKEIYSKVVKTNLEKYGVTSPIKNKYIKEKTGKTNLEKYGCINPMQNKDVQNKFKNSMIERYGVEYTGKNIDLLKKISVTMMKKYGVEYTIQNPSSKQKRIDTMLKKYGVEHLFQNVEEYEKYKRGMLKKYGVEHIFNIKDFRKIYSTHHSKAELKVYDKIGGEHAFNYNGKEYDIKVGDNLFEIDGDYIHCNKLTNLNVIQFSSISNDYIKIKDIENSPYTLYKIFISNLPKEITVENLIKNSYTPNFELNYDDVIMTKEYLKTIISKNGIKYINRIRKLTLKFLKVFGYIKNGENIKIIKNINYILGLDDGIVKDLTLSNIFN